MQKMANLKYLLGLDFFDDWRGGSLEEINKNLESQICKPHQVVYKVGDGANIFFVVRSGLLYMESIIDVEDEIRYPVGIKQWEVKKTIRKISYRVKELREGDMFGHEEIYDNCSRKCKVTSIEESEVFYMNVEDFKKHFSLEMIKKKMFECFPRIDHEAIRARITETNLSRKRYSEAILSAMELAPLKVTNREIHPEDKRAKKFKHLINKAKRHMCVGTVERDELDKMKTVERIYEFYKEDKE